MTGTEKTVEAKVRRLQDCLDRRHDGHVIAEHEEVRDTELTGTKHRDRGRGCSRLEPDGEEHDVTVRGIHGDAECIERRIYEAHVGAARLRLEQIGLAAGHTHHVAERGEDHPRRLGDGDRVVDSSHRDDTYGTARAVHELDALGQDMLDAVAVDRVRVTTADLHELEEVVTGQLGDARDQRTRRNRIPILVDVFHGLPIVDDAHASSSSSYAWPIS